MMKMREAFERTKELAGDKAVVAEFSMSKYDKPQCRLYIAGLGWYHADTWEDALGNLMGKEICKPPDEEEV